MSIKTDELQQLTSLLGTDSLLVDTGSAGTARITMANLAKCLTEQDNAVKTALSNKAALSAQQTVEAASVPSRTVEVEAAELASYIASLPRLLAENLTVEIKAGTVSEPLRIERFYGPGSLAVKAKESGTVFFTINIEVYDCAVPLSLEGFKFHGPSPAGTFLSVKNACVQAKNCVFDGADRLPGGGNVYVTGNGSLYLESCSLINSDRAINTQSGGIAAVYNCSGSGNHYGLTVMLGGIIMLSGTTPDLLGGTSNHKAGGIIAKANGTLL